MQLVEVALPPFPGPAFGCDCWPCEWDCSSCNRSFLLMVKCPAGASSFAIPLCTMDLLVHLPATHGQQDAHTTGHFYGSTKGRCHCSGRGTFCPPKEQKVNPSCNQLIERGWHPAAPGCNRLYKTPDPEVAKWNQPIKQPADKDEAGRMPSMAWESFLAPMKKGWTCWPTNTKKKNKTIPKQPHIALQILARTWVSSSWCTTSSHKQPTHKTQPAGSR